MTDDELKRLLDASAAENRRHLNEIAGRLSAEHRHFLEIATEGLRHEIQLVAEGVTETREAINREATDIREEVRRTANETQAEDLHR